VVVKKRKGRLANPEFVNLPKKMKCTKCGKEVNSNLSQLKKKAGKLKVTIASLIEKYVCQGCCSTIGRPKKVK
jgi:hypothetical protein